MHRTISGCCFWAGGALFLAAAALAGGCTREAVPPEPRAPQSGPERQNPADACTLDRAFDRFGEEAGTDSLRHFGALNPGEHVEVLDGVLARIFPQGVNSPGEAEVLAVLSYVAQTIQLKSGARHLGSEVLSEGQAQCYGFARAFEALCRRMGLSARINAVHNFGYMQAHNMAEVFYDGGWHLFDPTYGSFFYDRETYDRSGRVPSARELFSGSVTGKHVFMVCDTLWTGEYRPDWAVHPLADDFRYRGMFTQRQLYDRVLATAFPLVESDLAMSSFPVTIDMGDRSLHSIGKVDGRLEDVEGRREDATYPRYQGTGFLGHGVMGPAFHTVTFKAGTPGRFRMTYHFLPQSRFDSMGMVELRDVIIERQESSTESWSAWFRIQSAEGLFLVVNRRDTAFLDAITVERVE